MTLVVALLAALLAVALVLLWRLQQARRAEYIRSYVFPKGLLQRLQQRHPELGPKQLQLVQQGLRQFFLAYLKGHRQHVSMPSQVADDLWHEFILYTRHYASFCNRAFGGFLHHTPAAVLSAHRKTNEGLRRCWWHCCREENIRPRAASRLPLLFALDAKLGIAGGFRYTPDCEALRRQGDGGIYCGGDFVSLSYDGSIDGFPDGDSASGDSSGDSGCGGGCGS